MTHKIRFLTILLGFFIGTGMVTETQAQITVYTATDGGLSISSDDGASFVNRTTTDGLGNNAIKDVFVSGSTVYAATDGGLSISTDGGATFVNRTTTDGLGNNAINCVFASGSTVYATMNGGLSISTDGGATFVNRTTTDGLGSFYVYGVFASGSTVYAATNDGLSISTDGGATFVNRTTANGLGSKIVWDVFASGSTVYAATNDGLSISTDGGATFVNRTTTDGLGSNYVIGGLFVNGSTVYAATYVGLSISTDGGATFVNRTTTDGLGSNSVGGGVFASGSMVYAATIGGLSVSSDGGATFVNRTTANGLGNNRVKAVIAEMQTTVDLQISITESSDPVVAGSNGGIDNLVHTITVTNNGPATATNIVIQFGANTVPSPTLAFQAGSQGPGGNEWSIPSIALGNSVTMTMTWDIGSNYSGLNFVSSDALVLAVDQTDTDSNNDSDNESTTVSFPQVDLEVTISENVDPVIAGSNGGIDNLVHTITVTNNGPATATNIVIQFGANTVPSPTLAFQAGSQGPGGNEWSIPSIASGNSATMTMTWDIGSNYSGLNFVSSDALVLAVDQTDTDSNNDSDNESTTVSFPQVDLEVTISENVDPVIAGSNGGIDNLVHTITVTNNGPATATNIVIQFGANTVPSPTLAFQAGSQGPGGNEWSIPSIASGNSATMTMTWDVGLGYSDTNPISSDAVVLAVDQTDTDSNNDSATESTTVNPPAGLDICAEIDLLVDEVNALLNNPGTPRKSKSKLIKAKDYLNSACDNFTAGEYDRGFNDLADAADELDKAMDKGANADAVRIATVDLARLIATETIADAQAYAGDPAIDQLLIEAAEALADGDTERADDKFDKAVKEYGKAWELAAKAIQLAGNTGTGGEISMDLDPVLNAIDALLANNPNKKARKALQKAHGKVTDAQSKYDNGDIEDGYGKLEDAVGYLEDAADEGSDADPVIANLLTLGREYAVAKITEAQTYAGTPEVDQQITKAQNYLSDGDAAAAQGKNEKAMDRYGKAWAEAQEGVLLGNGLGKTTGDPLAEIPTLFGLEQNYPNPFNPETTIRFALPQSGNVTLKIFNLSGQLVRTLVSSEFAAGQHQIVWNGRNYLGEKVASGMYLYRITAGSFVQTKKMMLMK